MKTQNRHHITPNLRRLNSLSCLRGCVAASLLFVLCILLLGLGVEFNLTTALDDIESVVQGAGTNVRVQDPVLLPQLFDQAITLIFGSVHSISVLLVASAKPLDGDVLDLLRQSLALSDQLVAGLGILHLGILALLDLGVCVFPVLVTLELLHDLAWGDEGFEVFAVLGEVDLGGDDRVEPALYNAPDTCLS